MAARLCEEIFERRGACPIPPSRRFLTTFPDRRGSMRGSTLPLGPELSTFGSLPFFDIAAGDASARPRQWDHVAARLPSLGRREHEAGPGVERSLALRQELRSLV